MSFASKVLSTILLIILFQLNLFSQSIYLPSVKEPISNEARIILRDIEGIIKDTLNTEEAKIHNLAMSYIKVNAHKDSIKKNIDFLLTNYGLEYCETVFNRGEWSKGVQNMIKNYSSDLFHHIDSECKRCSLNIDSSLVKILSDVDHKDQLYRGRDDKTSLDMKSQLILDKENLQVVDSLIKIHGYIGTKKVGLKYRDVSWSVIQHSEIAIQKKNLNLIKEACDKHQMTKSNYAYTFDRISLSENKKQRYGTQYYFNEKEGKNVIYPIENPSILKNLRTKIGLEPIGAYLRRINNG
jgi:hypothetical protein